MSAAYAFLRFLNDVTAILNGRIGRRIVRRGAGKVTGRAFGRWLG